MTEYTLFAPRKPWISFSKAGQLRQRSSRTICATQLRKHFGSIKFTVPRTVGCIMIIINTSGAHGYDAVPFH